MSKQYKYLYVLSHQNMSTNPFVKIKEDFPDSKFFVGKNKLMQFTLGRTPEEELMPNLWLLAKNIKSEWWLLFTDDENVEDYFANYSSKDFARANAISPKTIILPEGPEAFETYSFAMESHFRRLGLPTKLVRQKNPSYKRNENCRRRKGTYCRTIQNP